MLRDESAGQRAAVAAGQLLGRGSEFRGQVLELVERRVDADQGEFALHDQEVELPQVRQRRERGDAAANRQRILCAARELLAEQGAEGLTMQAVAEAGGRREGNGVPALW
jgi:Bacterial regulatory proteins, tetR family